MAVALLDYARVVRDRCDRLVKHGGLSVDIRIRPAAPNDAGACGRILYEAFKGIAERHNFRPDFPSTDVGAQLVDLFINDPAVFCVVAESGGHVVGSNFLSEWDPVRGVGPITTDPKLQARGVGRRLMEAVMERGRGSAGVCCAGGCTGSSGPAN